MNIKKIFQLLLLLIITFVLFVAANPNEAKATSNNVTPVELRGVWVATVDNIDVARQNGTTEVAKKAYKQKLQDIIDKVAYYGMNTIFFQIRPANDAFYESQYNPWSQFLAGRGVDPGWDVLSWFLDECHSKGIEVHAWLNPYRVSSSNIVSNSMTAEELRNVKLSFRAQVKADQPNIDNPVVNGTDEEYLEAVVAGKEGKLILNPSRDTTINHINNTIREIIENYDVDGIHFDDYFYPSGGIEAGIDAKDYSTYLANGGKLSIADFRRDNVNRMVESVHNIIEEYNALNPEHPVAFGISPAAVWAPSSEKCHDSRGQEGGMNVICGSYSSYNDLYADTRLWVRNEWINYILPQNYYNYGEEYQEVASWWSREVANKNVRLYIGTPLYRVSEFKDSQLITKQMNYIESTTLTRMYVDGYVMFSYKNLSSSNEYLAPADQALFTAWRTGALIPSYRHYDELPLLSDLNIKVFQIGNKYLIKFNQVENAGGYVVSALKKTEAEYDEAKLLTAKVYNPTNTGADLIYEIPTTGPNVNNFYIRLFDKNNEEVGHVKVDFTNCIENPGATIDATYDNTKTYQVSEEISLQFEITSPVELPFSVHLLISLDGEYYHEDYELTQGEDGLYSYLYSPFMEGTYYMKLVVDDGDKPVELDLGIFNCGKENTDPIVDPTPIDPTPIDPTPSDTPKASGCSAFTISLTSFMALFGMSIIIIRKREH